MIAKQELRRYGEDVKVWIGKYQHLNNIAHWHFDYELCYVESGHADFFINGKKYPLKSGQAFFIGGKDVHYIRASKDSVITMFIISDELANSVTEGYKLKSPVLSGDYDIPEYYEVIKDELTNKSHFFAQAANFTIGDLLIKIFRSEELCDKSVESVCIGDFSRLIKEIDLNYAYYTFDEAAEYMGLNKTYFSAVFHKYAGMTFSQYLNRVKIEKAIEMIQSDKNLKITDVAMNCGFYTLRNFNRIFKEITGYTPKQLPEGFRLESTQVFSVSEQFNPIYSAIVLENPCFA